MKRAIRYQIELNDHDIESCVHSFRIKPATSKTIHNGVRQLTTKPHFTVFPCLIFVLTFCQLIWKHVLEAALTWTMNIYIKFEWFRNRILFTFEVYTTVYDASLMECDDLNENLCFLPANSTKYTSTWHSCGYVTIQLANIGSKFDDWGESEFRCLLCIQKFHFNHFNQFQS